MLKLDYSLQSPEERNDLVKRYLAENPDVSESYMEVLADYLILCMEKQEKQQRKILTENRLSTVNKRETSFEGLASQFENGEDGIYNLMTNDKYVIFRPKMTITKRDLDDIAALRQVREAITYWEERLKTATGKEVFTIKKTLIDLRKDQYIIKEEFRKPINLKKLTRSKSPNVLWSKEELIHGEKFADFTIKTEGASLLDPKVCSAILCNYSRLKENSWDVFDGDTWYLLLDFDYLCGQALDKFPVYDRIVECKIDGMKNSEIQEILNAEFGLNYSPEYISSLWRNKIPALIASAAEDQYLDWYFTEVEKGVYKRCSKCGQVKLAIPKYFSRNKTSKDGWYSVCKSCRNKNG